MQKHKRIKSNVRYGYLDSLRGIALFSMIVYHAVWDFVYIAGFDWQWFASDFAYIWQQSICWTFILLSGFCWSLGSRRLYHGALVLAAGILTSVVTWIFTYEERITFGVLTFLGVAMLLMILADKLLLRLPAAAGAAASMLLFLFTKGINEGFFGFYYWGTKGMQALKLVKLPAALYEKGYVFTFFGFTDNTFYSADYFSLFPWLFLFLTGYFLYRCANERNLLSRIAVRMPQLPFENMGRHSLIVYLLHQPIIYAALMLLGVIE